MSLRTGSAPFGVWMVLLVLLSSAPVRTAAQEFVEEPGFVAAQWIAPPREQDGAALPVFRREFLLKRSPRQATLRIVGLGDYDLRVNGRRVTPTGINQPWSQYEKTLYYRDIDLTDRLQEGTNCLGILLTHSFWHNPDPPAGRYNKPGPQRVAEEPLLLVAELTLRYADGAVERLGSDARWLTHPGPLVFSHIFAGEDFDATRWPDGWDRPGFEAAGWLAPRVVAAPRTRLQRQFWPGFHAGVPRAPVAVREPTAGTFLYAFAQNTAAQLRVELTGGQAGDRVTFRCGEHKNDQDRLFGNYVVSCDVIAGGLPVRHQWVSFYLGMQFVEVTGAVPEGAPNPDQRPMIRALELVPVRTALAETGAFESSSQLYNSTHRLIDSALRSNMSHVLTDCPHREKLGWLECAYLLAPSFQYRYDCREWQRKILRDIRDAQEPSGRVLTVAPSYPAGRFPGAFNWTVEWGAAAVLLPWEHYRWNGDPEVLRESFESMCRFTDYVTREAREGLAPGGLGDWYDYGHGQPPGPSRFTPPELSATATWALCARTVAQAAEVLGRAEQATRYRVLHTTIAESFRAHFQDRATGRLRHQGSPQCANAMALCAEVVLPEDRANLIREILEDLESRGWQQTAGDVGHVYFIRALAEAGRSDVLHRVYSREGPGSYGGILAKGLTSLPETWDAMMDGYQSLNHCMLGHVMEWFYGYVAGIRQAPESVGWSSIVVAPCPGSLEDCRASVVTPHGPVSSHWRRAGGRFRLEVDLPEGVEGVAVLPSGSRQRLTVGRQVLEETEPTSGGAESLGDGRVKDTAVLDVDGGFERRQLVAGTLQAEIGNR